MKNRSLPVCFSRCAAATLVGWLALASTGSLRAEQVISEDDASQGAYQGGWNQDGGGTGFSTWTFQQQTTTGDSHAGHFIANREGNPDCDAILTDGKAFGMFANGNGFEVMVAYRNFNKQLAPGDSFSFQMEHSDIVKKFDADDGPNGAIGVALRNGTANSTINDYNNGSRFEFGFYEGQPNYQVYDGEENHDSGIAWTDGGMTVKVTIVTADTYDLSVTTIADNKTYELKGRKLGGTAGTSIDSMAVFSRDGEKSDAYFNSFKITTP